MKRIIQRTLLVTSLLVSVSTLAFNEPADKAAVKQLPDYLNKPQPEQAAVQLSPEEAKLEQVKANVNRYVPGFEIDLIRQSDFPGFYEILSRGQIFFTTEDGKYLVAGKVFSFENGYRDLSNEAMEAFDMRLAPVRIKKIAEVPEESMIVFKAEQEKHVITVFTDVDCGYCQELHRNIGALNEGGVTVRYMAYPRAGMNSGSYRKLRSIWCAKDQQQAMTKGKLERTFGNEVCEDPIDKHYALVPVLGIRGTPAIFLESGRYLKGYVEPPTMLQIIEADARGEL